MKYNLQEQIIDYAMLSFAVDHYIRLKYEQIEVPWLVSKDAITATLPLLNQAYSTTYDEHLVGSAEQGFIQLMLENDPRLTPERKYFSVSPCFRRDILDHTHSNWFIKLELFYQCGNETICAPLLRNMINDATAFFEKLNISVEESPQDGFTDLMDGDLELGSYGIRKYKDYHWIFGTGLALPRTQLSITTDVIY